MITSVSNPAVTFIKTILNKPQKRREERVFVAEGKRLVTDMLKSGAKCERLFCTEEFVAKIGTDKNSEFELTDCELVSDNVIKAMTETKTPQGVVAVFKMPEFSDSDLMSGNEPMIMVLDRVSDPGNVGTIFRSFEAAGGSGIITLEGCADVYSGKCIRSTMGSAVRLPHIGLKDATALKEFFAKSGNKFKIYAADMDGRDYFTLDYSGPVAFVIGSEAFGVSDEIMSMVTDTVSIPMSGRVESLNAAISASVLGFTAASKRRIL